MWADFLSNFYPCRVVYNGHSFNSVEAAFQAQKDPSRAAEFEPLGPKEAKRLGKRVKLRPDWEQIKVRVMYELLCIKFSDPALDLKLKQTGAATLIEKNTWRDLYWGTDMQGNGKNVLGQLLMVLRGFKQSEFPPLGTKQLAKS